MRRQAGVRCARCARSPARCCPCKPACRQPACQLTSLAAGSVMSHCTPVEKTRPLPPACVTTLAASTWLPSSPTICGDGGGTEGQKAVSGGMSRCRQRPLAFRTREHTLKDSGGAGADPISQVAPQLLARGFQSPEPPRTATDRTAARPPVSSIDRRIQPLAPR